MRFLLLTVAVLPVPALSDTFVVSTKTSEVVLYAQAGIETHAFELSLPAGTHEIILPDLPPFLDPGTLLINSGDLVLTSLRLREEDVPPRTDHEPEDVEAARKAVKSAEIAIRDVEDTARAAELSGQAANARIRYLDALGQNEGLNQNPAALAEIADLVETQTLAARQAMFASDIAARTEREKLPDLEKELARAKAALAALVPEPEDRPLLALTVRTDADLSDAPVRVSFVTDATWSPTYDWHLDSDGTLALDRGAFVAQNSGANWQDVRLTLSTQDLLAGTRPSTLRPLRRRIEDPQPQVARSNLRALSADAVAEPTIEAPVIVEETGFSVESQGLALTYAFPSPVDVASDADQVWLPFDTLTFSADLFARATPLYDDTAYVTARFENTSDEPVLPSYRNRLFFDGGLVGTDAPFETIVPGQEVELGFGQIPGLTLEHAVLNRNEGDRGIISKSNEREQSEEIVVTNLTDKDWRVELLHRIPYSEQEDLEITWSAQPSPDITTVDNKRGILQWNLNMTAGDSATIITNHKLTWPEGKLLR